jgi:hypothetical protein
MLQELCFLHRFGSVYGDLTVLEAMLNEEEEEEDFKQPTPELGLGLAAMGAGSFESTPVAVPLAAVAESEATKPAMEVAAVPENTASTPVTVQLAAAPNDNAVARPSEVPRDGAITDSKSRKRDAGAQSASDELADAVMPIATGSPAMPKGEAMAEPAALVDDAVIGSAAMQAEVKLESPGEYYGVPFILANLSPCFQLCLPQRLQF